MSCFCGIPVRTDNEIPPILDVENIIKDHVWNIFTDPKNMSRLQRLCLKRRDFTVNVPMNYFHFDYISQSVTPRIEPQLGDNGHIFDQSNQQGDKPMSARERFDLSAGNNAVVIKTDFVNDTDLEQTYKFRLEKTRRAVLKVSVQRGYSIGGKVSFVLGLPKPVSDSQVQTEGTFSVNITKQEDEEVEETVVLETTSDINVQKRSKCVAKVVLAENRVSYNFTILSRMSMPTGGAPVTITRNKDGKVFLATTLKKLDTIFEPFKSHVKIETMPSDLKTENYVIRFKTTGIIEGVRLSDHRIILKSSDIKSDRICERATPGEAVASNSHGGPIINEIE